MAFVTDQHDPSGLGMFSKVGRFTSEKYIIFQKKDEILHNKRKFLKVSNLPNIDIKPKNEEDDDFDKENEDFFEKKDELVEQAKEKKVPKPEIKKLKEEKLHKTTTQPFQKMLSREKVERRLLEKNPPPPCGYYKPKYTEIDKHPHAIWDFLKTNIIPKINAKSPKSVRSSTASKVIEEDFNKPIPERLKPKILGPLTLMKQSGRDYKFLKSPCNPHEGRFSVLKFNESWSNFKKTPSFNISSRLGREDNKMYINKEFAPDYNPNFEVGKEKIDRLVIPFEKTVARKHKVKFSSTQNENFFDYDYYTKHKQSHIYRKVYTPDLKKQLPREADSNVKLPGFMQKFLNTRMTITLLSQKMIEMNNFMDGNFQGIYSSFKSPSKKIEKEELDDTLSIDEQD